MNRLLMTLVQAAGWAFVFVISTQAQNAYRGLWVGEVSLSHVNEVTIPLDETNVPIAPDPVVPTAASDVAQLRLILHVNHQGQVHLLKDVAILQRTDPAQQSTVFASESDLSLVTDERLYPDFPAQKAVRIASAVFDFGDAQATRAVDAIVDQIAEGVSVSVFASGVSASSGTAAVRLAEDNAEQAAIALAQPVVDVSDAASEFADFLITHLPETVLDAIAVDADPATAAIPVMTNAVNLRDDSFYGDTRGIDLLDDVIAEVQTLTNNTDKIEAARFIAARYADVENGYERFITGSDFGNLIVAAGKAAGTAAAGASNVADAVNGDPTVVAVKGMTSSYHISAYTDTAAEEGAQAVMDAAILSGEQSAANPPVVEGVAITAAESAALAAALALPRQALPVSAPTADYTTFVQSSVYQDSVAEAAEQAAIETVATLRDDPFSTVDSLNNAARIAATEALRPVYVQAALARRTELPMTGTFEPGSGDTTREIDLNGASLTNAGLFGLIYLPASHSTNPFRHPKHPDHTSGVNIERSIRLDFNGSATNPLSRAAFGVDQVTGVYREEIHGLHKPLGPDPVNQPIGLKVEGTFALNRISLIDTLNAQ